MPSIIPSYVYTIVASLIVGTLIVTACGLATVNVKAEAETQQLSNIANYIATKSMALLANTPSDNSNLTTNLDLPTAIGNQRYWIQILNDSSIAWVEAGFGDTVFSSAQLATIPCIISASGIYISGSGPAFLECENSASGLYLNLYGGSQT